MAVGWLQLARGFKSLAAGLLLVLAAACGDDGPSTPTAPTLATNPAPVTFGSIPAQTLEQEESVRLDMADYFRGPDGEALTYEATSSDAGIATVSVSESTVTVTAVAAGQADVSVTARDPQGAPATQMFSVTVEEPFTLSGTVSDSRRAGLVLPGAVVRLENGVSKSVTTDANGRYRFSHVAGSVTVTVEAGPSYVAQTVTVMMDGDRTVDFALRHTGTPPYAGTVYITPDLLTPSDPTSLRRVSYAGQGVRRFLDTEASAWVMIGVHLFDVQYAGGQVEFQVHPEFGQAAARAEVDKYAPALGRIPAVLLQARDVEISDTDARFTGSPVEKTFHIFTDDGEELIRTGYLEEVFIHEGGHISLDAVHYSSSEWFAAQRADGVFISTYAQDNPNREDIAESILPYFAVRYLPERLTDADRSAIVTSIPNRLAYFDGQRFDMSPYTATGSIRPATEQRSIAPTLKFWRPFEGAPTR